jgi:hypothetical protein
MATFYFIDYSALVKDLVGPLYQPDDKGDPSSGGDVNHKLESRTGTGLLAQRVGFVGLG